MPAPTAVSVTKSVYPSNAWLQPGKPQKKHSTVHNFKLKARTVAAGGEGKRSYERSIGDEGELKAVLLQERGLAHSLSGLRVEGRVRGRHRAGICRAASPRGAPGLKEKAACPKRSVAGPKSISVTSRHVPLKRVFVTIVRDPCEHATFSSFPAGCRAQEYDTDLSLREFPGPGPTGLKALESNFILAGMC
eukprot:1367800-Amorphochlora_amoeboformis.AAC.1